MADEPGTEQKVTLGEVYRLTKSISDRLDSMVTRPEWVAYQAGVERRFIEVERRQDEWKRESQEDHVALAATDEKNRGESDKVHTEIRAEVAAVRKEVHEAAEKQRDSRAKLWIGIGLAALAAILPRIVDIFIQGGAA